MNNKTIYCCWLGTDKMSESRHRCLKQFKKKSGCNVVLITLENMNNYILDEHPLHESFYYLSEIHRADYFRTYLMHFYGGGYSDIKKTTYNWIESFKKLQNSDKWIMGYREIRGGEAEASLKGKYRDLIGNCAYICKSNTKLTNEWYNEMIKLLDSKLDKLKQNPASFNHDCKERGNGYPIEWNEMLGRIFHKIVYKYKDKCLNTLPLSIFRNYR